MAADVDLSHLDGRDCVLYFAGDVGEAEGVAEAKATRAAGADSSRSGAHAELSSSGLETRRQMSGSAHVEGFAALPGISASIFDKSMRV